MEEQKCINIKVENYKNCNTKLERGEVDEEELIKEKHVKMENS